LAEDLDLQVEERSKQALADALRGELERKQIDVLQFIKTVLQNQDTEDQDMGLPKRVEESSFQDISEAVWLEKNKIKDWVPEEKSLHQHFLRSSLFLLHQITAVNSKPKLPDPEELVLCGFRFIDDSKDISPQNIAFDFGQD